MKVRIVYAALIALTWQLLPTALVGPGQNPSLTGFVVFGMVYSLGFMLILWLLGLLRDPVASVTCLFSAWMTSGLLNLLLYLDSQGVGSGHGSADVRLTHRAPDPTFVFVFLAIALVMMAELFLWAQRAQVVAVECEDPR